MKRVTVNLSQVLPEIKMPETRKKEVIRTTCHEYPSIYQSGSAAAIRPYVKLEVTQMGDSEPSQEQNVQCYITDHLQALNDHQTIEKYHLEPVRVRVLGLERTFDEKVSCLIKYSHALEPYSALSKQVVVYSIVHVTCTA